jgi:hypothetical protein
MLRALLSLFFVVALAGPAAAQANDEEQIRAAVFDYFHGQGEHSRERLERAFAGDYATMVSVIPSQAGPETVRTFRNMNDVIDNWVASPNPANGARDGEILEIHVLDGRIATVFFRYEDRYYDALTLAKINGQWKIIAKAFIRQQR